jgi:hypothetical protein
LAEADRLEPAWEQCRILSNMLSSESDPQNAGKTYWVMGNVAFLRNDAAEGTRFHRLASEHLSPGNDIYLWCRFNKASAAMRLSARVLEPETYECIERAELAISIIGGSERERLQISLNRAHWFYLTGELEQAAVILRRICAATSELAAQTLGEATLLLGKTLHAQGKTTEALDVLLASEVHFRAAGAEDRANHVLALAGKYSQQ